MKKEMEVGGPMRDLVDHYVRSREVRLAVLDGIQGAFTPEEVMLWLREAMEVAKETKAARTMLEIVKFVAEYTVGKPTQHIEVERGGNPADWVRVFSDNANEIEGEVTHLDEDTAVDENELEYEE